MKIHRLLMSSGLLAALTAAVHTFAGTAEIQGPLLHSALSSPLRLLLYACWHLVTVTLVLSAVALIRSALPTRTPASAGAARFVAWLWLFFGLVFVAVALIFSGPSGLLTLPQWVLLIPVGILGLLGTRK
ncbi:hypothetical protein OOT46_09220 [Aquabacterium sp. A7-Y]|uniref:hypothetical protein n=1 Tax=Aquabacterium sp. A7-Y TaxID=1349605 RepID=UPI00223CF0B4|nr:hypothetical protein [Aquabacterium sp. A7-Y]MCW7538026.1 hypothetical protein [Aquabacterium sp. A7-Y]